MMQKEFLIILMKFLNIIDNIKIPLHKREKLKDLLSNIYGLLQRQDLHRQKIERVVNFVCDKNDIDKGSI
jgi:hypothetical protein